MMFRVACRILNDYMDAEDVVANVLCRFWEKRSELKDYENIEKTLYRATKNECIDLIRKKKHENIIKKELMTVRSGFEQSNINKSKTDYLNEIIFRLPETQKLIIHFRMTEGYTLGKIAELLNMKVNTVEVNLSRARKKIREEYEKAIS